MAGGVHASSPGSATVTHQMGHSVFPPEYTLHSQTILENGVSPNENNDLNESSTSRKRKLSSDASHQLGSKRTCIYNHFLNDMIIEKEKYLYISLLDKYGCGDEIDFLKFIDKINYSDSVLPFPSPHQPKQAYLSSEPEHFQTPFENEFLLSGLTKVLKQESNEPTPVSQTEFNSKSYSPIVLIRPAVRPSNFSGESNSQQIAEKAKQEAYVLQRVAELQKCGLWTEKRLPKIQEPPRVKAHWDYVLEELEWLATDFAQERKWKKAAARKRSRMVQKHFQEREALVHKAAKAAELYKRRIASHLAKMVKSFWNNVEKLVDFKQQTKLKEKRQQALDQHLSFIVDKTEQYSSLVAESMNKSTLISSQDVSRSHSPDRISDAEFEPNQSSSDDEETIEAEEKGSGADTLDHNKEIEMLKRESELPIEDLLNQLPAEYLNNVEVFRKTNDNKLADDDDEYKIEEDESDDESTLLEEEKKQGVVDYKSEIAELEADNNLSIEDLLKKYNADCADAVENSAASSNSESPAESLHEESNAESSDNDYDDEDGEGEVEGDDEEEEDNDDDDDDDDEEEEKNTDDEGDLDDDGSNGLKSLMRDSVIENGDMNDENADEKIDNVAAIAESIQPKGNTLSSTSVVTKVPFLLKHSLREYQHIGLDWLVTMYERKLNGILADEMGLGKTIQTIALLAHLASDKEDWGPHLIIVPTSVMLNWEMEFKKWCPAFKILTYYGNPKERKLKRSGWTKPNTFHVCITSYKLVLQDHHCFRRKKWKYLILDEAQNIKNFKSQRWQRLLNFDSERRLLLTGTPLQNNLMELWSLMHFLMPTLFASHREFKEWFSNPVTGMIEGNSEYNENIIKRLHKVLRPFLLRRLKIEVEKQLPSKYEHVVMCRLSNRQRYLYDDFMSRAKTKETLSSGNLLSVINILMQLRKVCNHPNLFEPRPIISPFQMEGLCYHTASLAESALDYSPFQHANIDSLNLRLIESEDKLTAWGVHRMRKLQVPKKLIEEIDEAPCESPPIPKNKINFHVKTPNDLSGIKLNSNVKNNQKLISFFKNVSPTISQNSNAVNNSSIGATKMKLAPIFRTVLAQGEVNNMAVKRKPLENAITNKGYTVQFEGTRINTVPQKFCIATTSVKTPIHATVLKNMLPGVSIKNTHTGTDGITSTVGTVSSNASASSTTKSVPLVGATLSAASCSTIATSIGTILPVVGSTSVLCNSLPPGKQFILATSNSVSKPLTSTTTVKTAGGQKLILTKSASGNFDTIVRLDNVGSSSIITNIGPVIRLPSTQQTTVLNNTSGSAVVSASSVVLNNTQKTSIAIPKPISTFVTSTVALSTITSSTTQSNMVSSVGIVTRSKNEGKGKERVVLDNSELTEKRRLLRKEKLRILAEINNRKSSPYVMFGCDVRNTLKVLDVDNKCRQMDNPHYWKCTGHMNCINAQYAKHVYSLCDTLTNALSNSVKSIEERIQELSETFSKFIVYVPAVNARRPALHVSHPNPSKNWSLSYMECVLEKELAPRSKYLHQIVSKMSTAFPDSRLIQYDCGKLQTLDTLLRRLKVEQHRVLIFTQMARMLDVLEIFLTFHGHIYLRLDGSTRIDQRQLLMERFNADKRYFCFILSTRSGGIGVNLTGADTVVFYDSDWNPTMDAQAQDRCHRIGQTRDVHIYRLISEKTVEENILKKANQKKLLGDLAIEGGNFTAAYFKSSTIHDLFNVDFDENDPAKRISDLASDTNSQGVEKSTLNAYETALAAAEDELDVDAAKTAKEEAVAELAEFDENIPLVENEATTNLDSSLPTEEFSKAEQKVNALLEQLTPIERWALRFMETVDAEWAEEQLAAAEAEIEQQKKEWEMERLAIEQADEKSKRLDDEFEDDENHLMYASEDSKNQAWLAFETFQRMPIWLPLPPIISVEENEEYIDRSMNYLYESVSIPEHLLPPIYYRKEKKKLRLEQPSSNVTSENAAHIRVRSRHREGLTNATLSVASLEPPKSLFDRPSPIVSKLRQDMRLQKYRGLSRSAVPNVPGLKPYFHPKINADPEFVPEWLIHEDYALLQAIQHVQELPLNLSIMYPGHTANWDLVSELVNQVSRIYRSPQQCKNRFETAILPREEGKLTSDPINKKQKKMKGVVPLVPHMKYTRNYKTAQLYAQDSNSNFTQMINTRFEAIKAVSNRRAPTIKRLPLTITTKNPKHAQLLAEYEIDYERPLTPVEIATRRAQRLAKEKQTQMATAEQLLQRQGANSQQQTPHVAKQSAVQQVSVQQSNVPQQLQQQLQTPLMSHKSVSLPTANIIPQQTAVVVNITQNSPITTASPVTIRNIVRPLNVQEMIVASSASSSQSSIVIPSTKSTLANTTATRIIPITSPTVSAQRIMTTSGKTLTSSQLQLYRQQNALVRQQGGLKILQSRGGKTSVVMPANVVVSSHQQQTQQQAQIQSGQIQSQQSQVQTQPAQRQLIKSIAGTVATSTTADFAVLIKKQQQQQIQQQKINAATVIATTNATITSAQFITAQSTSVGGHGTVGVTLPTIKTASIGTANIKTTPATAQHIRQLAIQQHYMAQQRKLSAQKITPIGQVMVNVTQSGGQVISHVLTKTTQGNVGTAAQLMSARVIPVVTSNSAGKQTIQVVNASALRAANASNMTVDTTNARHIQQNLPSNAIKISSGTSPVSVTAFTHQQNILNQVTAAMQNNSPLAVRQGNIRIQNTAGIAAGTVSSPSGSTVSSSSPNSLGINLPSTQTQSSNDKKVL